MDSNAPNLPIIILTGLKDDIFAVSAVGRGAQDYLVKGEVNGKLLARSIKYSMERKRIEKELNQNGGKIAFSSKGRWNWNIRSGYKKDEVIWTEELENIYYLPIENLAVHSKTG